MAFAKRSFSGKAVDLHQSVTDKIVALLEKGVRPWTRSWGGANDSILQRPLRFVGKPYNGINVVILWATAMEQGYQSPYWMSLQQANEVGARVRKGEKSTPIVFYTVYTKTDNDTGEESKLRIPRAYRIFNADQIDGLSEKFHPQTVVPVIESKERDPRAEEFFDALGANISYGGNTASYTISKDSLRMPEFKNFHTADDYYATQAHEYIHWTRHPSRLDRSFDQKRFGDQGYAREELVAELGAAFWAADFGMSLEPREDHASYLANWLTILRNDKRAIFAASAFADKAVKYLYEKSPVAFDTDDESVEPGDESVEQGEAV
jgi:antirestriction protein ArdC